jgi:hypothetical protein
MTLKAGSSVAQGAEPSSRGPNPFHGLTIGRIIHVCLRLPTPVPASEWRTVMEGPPCTCHSSFAFIDEEAGGQECLIHGPQKPLVERPAIVTEVLDHDQGIISARVFMSPADPPGEILITEMEGTAIETVQPLGAHLTYFDHPQQPKKPLTWHWPERA